MKKITITALASAMTLSSLNSHAAAAEHSNKTFMPKGNFYLQAESGYSYGSKPYILRGGYEKYISPHWSLGVEGGYLHLNGKHSSEDINHNFLVKGSALQGVDLLGVIKYQASNGFSVFSRAGLAYLQQTQTFKFPGMDETDHIKELRPELGFGLGYQVSEKVTLTTSVNRIFEGRRHLPKAKQRMGGIGSVTSLLAGIKLKLD